MEAPAAITVVVEEVLTDPHPLVAKSIKALRGGRISHDGYLRPKTADCLTVEASMGCIDRAMRLYDAVIRAIEDRGHAVEIQKSKRDGYEQPQYRTAVLIDGEDIELAISETTKRIERPRSSPEQRPTYEFVPSGRLALSIQNQSLGRRFRWSDNGKRTLDSQLGSAIHGLAVAAVEIKAQKAAHAEYQRQQMEAQRRAWEEADRKRAEAGRIRALNAEIDRMHTARWVREYLEKAKASLTANPESDTAEMRAWIEWVEAYAERIDPFIPYAVVPKDPNPYG